MQVVLASGEIVDANANSNADLFRSLKGGKSNFGIVTRVDVKTHAQDTIWGGAIMYPLPETEDAQLEAFWNFKNSDGYDEHAQVELSFISRGPNGSFVSNNHWYGRHFERPASFEQDSASDHELDAFRDDSQLCERTVKVSAKRTVVSVSRNEILDKKKYIGKHCTTIY